MKQAKKLKVFGLMTMLISMVFMVSSCSDDDTGGGALSYGKVTGVVTDDLSSPLEGVTVLVDGSGITATPDGPWKIQCKLPPKTKRFCPLVLK